MDPAGQSSKLQEPSSTARYFYFALGWVFLGLGFLGIFLPVLPTTPMIIVAAWAFARSSARFYNWLYSHALFGPMLERWDRHRVIPIHAKIIALSAMAASFIYLVAFSETPTWVLIAAGLIMAYGAWYVASRSSRVPETAGTKILRD